MLGRHMVLKKTFIILIKAGNTVGAYSCSLCRWGIAVELTGSLYIHLRRLS